MRPRLTPPAPPPSPPDRAPVEAVPAGSPRTGPRRSGSHWISRVAALVSVALFIGGALRIAHWMRERREVAEAVEAPKAAGSAARSQPAFVEPDPRMLAYMTPLARFGPVRRMPFGSDPALFASGSSRSGPDVVFADILRAWAPAQDAESLRRAVREGPSAVGLLRLQATVGAFPGGASLVRLPPAPASLADGRLRLEPGGVVLGWDFDGRWEYVLFYFPRGLDLAAFTQVAAPPDEAIAVLGREGREALVPELRLGGSDPGDPSTVLCRARGPAGAAVGLVADGLARRGYSDVSGSRIEGEEEQLVRILEGPRGTVWLTTADGGQDGGLVTVTMATN